MNNKKIYLSILLCVLLLAMFALAACNAPYVLVFETNGGTPLDSINFKKGQKITVPTTTKEYFTFNGWYEDEELTTPFDQFDGMPDHDVTLYAKWTAGESGMIKFVTNGGSAVQDLTGVVGQRVSQPEAPTKYGYTFAGWYKNADFTGGIYVFGTFPAGTTTLYAKWSKDVKFNYVTYVLNGVSTDQPVSAGEKATVPDLGEDVVCAWYTDANYTNLYNFNLPVNTDITLYGVAYTKGLEFSGNAVVAYSGDSKQILIPSKYEGMTITTVRNGAFYSQDVQYVTLPDTVTTIEEAAFYRCQYLVNINVTSKVTSIGKYAFAGCTRMVTAVDASGVSVIGDNAFADCSFLSEVIFGNNLSEIGVSAFINCGALVTADLPNSVKTIKDYAFANSGIVSLNIPTSLTQWGKGVVKGCNNLSAISGGNATFVVDSSKGTLVSDSKLLLYVVTASNQQNGEYVLPSNITGIEPYAFYGNATLTKLDLSNSNQPLTLSSLEGMQALETLVVKDLDANHPFLAYWFGAKTALDNSSSSLYTPASLKTINFTDYQSSEVADYAFYGVNGLNSVVGLNGVTTIGKYAYAYTALTTYAIGSGINSVELTAFRGVDALTEITVDASNANYSAFDGALYDKDGETLLYVPEGKTEIQFAPHASEIASGAMYQSKIGELIVPDSIEKIGFGAFENMSRISALTVPFIGDGTEDNQYMLYVFGAKVSLNPKFDPDTQNDEPYLIASAQNCPASLNKIVISGTLTAIPEYAFAFCQTVTDIDCGKDYTSIGCGAFYDSGVKSAIIPDSVSTIGSYAYYECDNLTNIVIGKGATSVGDWAFASNSSLKSIVFEEGDKPLTIGEGAFFAYSYMDSYGFINAISVVTEIVFSNNIVSIGDSAFTYLGYFGYAAAYTGQLMYDESTTYTYLKIVFDVQNSQLETLGEGAFYQSGISSVVLPASLKSIGDYAFDACFVLTDVTVGSAEHEATVFTNIGAAAFINCIELASLTIHKTITEETRSAIPQIGVVTTSNGSYGAFEYTHVYIYVPKNSVEYYKAAWNTNPNNLANYILAIEEA